MSNLNEERMRKFREMGIPMPMAPVDPATAQGPVRNVEFAKKLAAIKNGAQSEVKEVMNTFIEKEKFANKFAPLPENKSVGQKKQAMNEAPAKELPKHAVKGESFDKYEAALYGNSGGGSGRSASQEPSTNVRNYTSNVNESVDNGSEFLTDIRTRLAEKFSKPGQTGQVSIKSNQQVPTGHKLINEAELHNTITVISSQLIKKFMSEFLLSEPNLIKETDKIKKAEIIQENVVKIDGKYFKLTPVTVKKK